MLEREEIEALAAFLVTDGDPVATARLQLLFAERAARSDIPADFVELGDVAICFVKSLAAHPEADVSAILTNVVRGIASQLRVAIAVVEHPPKEG